MGPVLVERDGTLRVLEDVVRAAAEGRGSLAWIEGDAGTGKTEIADAIAVAATRSGFAVARAIGEEERAEQPFGLTGRLLTAAVEGLGPDVRTNVFEGAAAPAADLLAGTATAPGGPSVVNAATWALANLAEHGPVALVVDDAHWSDTASLRVLRALSCWLSELPIALLVCTRREASGFAGHALATLRDAANATERLGPLSDLAVAAVVRQVAYPDADGGVCAACAAATGGNPLLLHELLASLLLRGVAAPDVIAALATMEAGSPAVALSRLPDEATATAEALAILGADTTLQRLAALTGHEVARVESDLDRLREAGLVAPAGVGIAFAHALLRAAVDAQLAPDRRGTLHARAAALLHAEGAAPAHVAAHLLAAPAGLAAWAIEVLLEVGREAAAFGAPECGVPALRRALIEPAGERDRAAVLYALGAAEAAAGEDHAGRRFDEAAALLDDPRERSRSLVALADWHAGRGETRAADAAFARALSALGDVDPELARSLEATRLSVALLDATLLPSVRERIERIATDPPTALTAGERRLLAVLGWERSMSGARHDAALPLARAALDDGRLLADQTSDGLTVYFCTGVLWMAERFEEAVGVLDDALADSRVRGSVNGFANASYCRGWPNLELGRVDDAVADFELALGTVRHGWDTFVPMARAGISAAVLERSGPREALEVLDLEGMRERYQSTVMFPNVLLAAAAARQALGDHRGALAHARQAGDLLADIGWHGMGYCGWRSVAATSAIAVGDLALAATLVEEDLSSARAFAAPRVVSHALRGAASLAVDRRERVELLEEAVATLDGSDAHLARAYATVDLGHALHAGGDVDGARTALRRGLDAADRMGARTLAATARARLVAAGGRPRRARLSGVSALTPAERRVVSLAAEGMTNREIAEALWVTRKAVEFNLSRAYAKLGVRREQLAAALAGER